MQASDHRRSRCLHEIFTPTSLACLEQGYPVSSLLCLTQMEAVLRMYVLLSLLAGVHFDNKASGFLDVPVTVHVRQIEVSADKTEF